MMRSPISEFVFSSETSERENCCNDVAIELGNVNEYAKALLTLESARLIPEPVPALAASGGDLNNRIRRMVGSSNSNPKSRQLLHQPAPWAASMLALMMLVSLVIVGHRSVVAAIVFPQQSQEKQVENPTEIRKDFAKTDLGKVLDKEMEKLKQVGFSGAILVAHKGEIILAKSEGFMDVTGKKPIKPHTLFELASFSKSFTSTLAMILAQQGKLDLDASIADYLPNVPENCKTITVRHLMQHTSGMPRDNYGNTRADLATAVKTMLAGGPIKKPGTDHAYWNQGYILLSEVITKAAGKPFVEVSKELIFDPCAMTGTCFNGDQAPKNFLVSTGVGELGAPRSCLEHPYGKIELVYQGTGGIVSNVHDVWKFHKALMGEELLNEKSKAELFDAGNFGYALGWRVGKTSGGDRRHSHGGRVRGFNCNFARYPDSDSCIVVLSNNDAAPTIRVTNVIEGILFPAKKMPKALDAELAKKCVGQYKDAKGRVLSVELSGAQATYAIFWGPGNPNAPISRGYLLKNESDEIVMYQPGDVSAVELVFDKEDRKVKSITNPALELTFERTK